MNKLLGYILLSPIVFVIISFIIFAFQLSPLETTISFFLIGSAVTGIYLIKG